LKRYVVFAGVNGAGKSTLYYSNPEKYPFRINSDDILKTSGGDWRNAVHEIAAMRESVRLIKECFRENKSFSQETTLTGKTILNNIKKAKSLGYFIEMHYVSLESADIAVERVNKRVNEGGHGIPEDVIRKRYIESWNNFKNFVAYYDLVVLYDNTQKFEFVLASNKPILTGIEYFKYYFDLMLQNNRNDRRKNGHQNRPDRHTRP
jgi:predicted ABC-type ATPase